MRVASLVILLSTVFPKLHYFDVEVLEASDVRFFSEELDSALVPFLGRTLINAPADLRLPKLFQVPKFVLTGLVRLAANEVNLRV